MAVVSYHEGRLLSRFPAAGAIAPGTRVRLVSGAIAAAAAAEVSLGILHRRTHAAGDPAAVVLWNAGTFPAVASATVAVGDRVRPAANGKFEVNAAGLYQALTAAAGDNDLFEVAEVR